MKFVYTFILSTLLLAACSDQPQENKAENTDTSKYECIIPPPDSIPTTDTSMSPTTRECYRFDKGEQHKWMVINRSGDSAWGDLHFQWEGKDGANGDFHGKYHGDTLWIIFEAKIEGSLFPREVAFLKNGDKLFEAQGTQEEGPKGIYYYQYRKRLEYSDPEPLVKGPCM